VLSTSASDAFSALENVNVHDKKTSYKNNLLSHSVYWINLSTLRKVRQTNCAKLSSSWQCGSLVRTWVFGWQTFPDLRLIYDWHVTTLWVKCQLWVNQHHANAAFNPFGVNKWVAIHVLHGFLGVETIKRQTKAAHGCLDADSKFRGHRFSLWSIGCMPALSMTQQRRCCCSFRLWHYHGLYGGTICCISHGPCQRERAIFDPPQLRHP